jgi:hypothetical protein
LRLVRSPLPPKIITITGGTFFCDFILLLYDE